MSREVGGGRATRQPGQVRKEAALTRFGTGRRANLPPFCHLCLRYAAPLVKIRNENEGGNCSATRVANIESGYEFDV